MEPQKDSEIIQEVEPVKKITKHNLLTGIRVLIGYLGNYRNYIIMLTWMGIISAVGNGIIPYVAGKFFDSIITPSIFTIFNYSMPLFAALLILWAAIQLTTYLLDWRSNITSEYLSNIIWLDYISRGFGFLLNLPMTFHKTAKSGDIVNKINQAGGALETIAGRIVIDLAPQILSIVIALGIALYLKPLLGLLLIVGLAVYVFVLIRKIQPLAGFQKEYWSVLSRAYGDAYDTAENTLAIKQATAEKYEQEKMSKRWKSAFPLWMKQTNVWGSLNLYQRLTILGTQILIFIISIIYIRQGTMTLGELLAFNAYAAMVFGPFITIARNWQTIQNGVVNIEEAEKIFNLPTEPYELPGSLTLDIKGDIELKNVSFGYEDGKQVLQDISFKAEAGQVVALVGESGVGKSTIIDLISAYHFANSGEILIDGHPITNLNLRKLRQQIAVVPQEVVLFNDTIGINVKYGNFEATDEMVREAARKAHALDFIEKFPQKWNTLVGERGIKLSVGQKQRIAIARAILRNPRILILDEPTSALDAGSEKIITESLDTLMKGKTTFIIAHRLSTVRKADKILVFKEGRIIETGTHQELLKIEGGEYRRLHELQIGLHE